jgi:hypothetical protein
VLPIIINIIFYYTTQFKKTIIIQDKYTIYRKYASNYNIVDDNDTIYKIENIWFKGDFNRADEYAIFRIGKKYKVKGYGKRIPLLNMYKSIYQIEQ